MTGGYHLPERCDQRPMEMPSAPLWGNTRESAEFANNQVAETAALVAAAGIIEKAPVAEKAIPYCSITYVDGDQMKSLLSGYLKVLFDMEPASVGGILPADDFYYMP